MSKIDLQSIAGKIAKVVKEDHVVDLDPNSMKESLPHISTRNIALDYLIGGKENEAGVRPCPGIPKGKISMIYGLPSAGKTTIALQTCATICAEGGTAIFIDYEHEVDHRYASLLGVPVSDKSKFMLIQPDTMETGLQYIFTMAKHGVDLIVIDSVGAPVPKAQFEKKPEETMAVGLLARLWSQYLPKLKVLINNSNTAVLGISQLREAIGGGPSFGGPKRIPQGGKAWTYYNSLQIMLRVISKEKGKEWDAMNGKYVEKVLGAQVRAKLDKCKVSDSAHKEADFYLMSGQGVDDNRTIIDLGIRTGVIKKGGAWYRWNSPEGEIKGQGLPAFREKLTEDHMVQIFNEVKPYLSEPSKTEKAEKAELEEIELDLDFDFD